MVKWSLRLFFRLQVSCSNTLFYEKFTGGSLLKGASLSRLCIVSVIPVVNVVSLGQTYTVADKKTGISEDIICGAIIPLVGLY